MRENQLPARKTTPTRLTIGILDNIDILLLKLFPALKNTDIFSYKSQSCEWTSWESDEIFSPRRREELFIFKLNFGGCKKNKGKKTRKTVTRQRQRSSFLTFILLSNFCPTSYKSWNFCRKQTGLETTKPDPKYRESDRNAGCSSV